MLGEDHSLAHEFPDHLDVIKRLAADDVSFADEVKTYDTLDKEIRVLELKGNPIDDDEMHKLKNRRAELKDYLYERLKKAS